MATATTTAAKKTATRKPAAKKAATRKPLARKTTAKKTTAPKTTAKKTTARKVTTKKTTARFPVPARSRRPRRSPTTPSPLRLPLLRRSSPRSSRT